MHYPLAPANLRPGRVRETFKNFNMRCWVYNETILPCFVCGWDAGIIEIENRDTRQHSHSHSHSSTADVSIKAIITPGDDMFIIWRLSLACMASSEP